MAGGRPFALLWDESISRMRLFTRPLRTITGQHLSEALPSLHAETSGGKWVAGGLPYEAGTTEGHEPLWFGVFDAPELLTERESDQYLAELAGGHLPPLPTDVRLSMERGHYLSMIERALSHIRAGDVYQVNLGLHARFLPECSPPALFATLFSAAGAPGGGLIADGRGRWWASLSPELFFHLEGDVLTVRPMKGTAARTATTDTDQRQADTLGRDAKNRSENLMITDLMRNDIAQVCQPGSVRVDAPFRIETYPTVHQMTSTVRGTPGPGTTAADVLDALFPCGSITGAPRRKAMELIDQLEPGPRGIWCGAMGWMAPGGKQARFSVTIRTLVIRDGQAELGIGSGIVAESQPMAEWNECLAKAAFLRPAAPDTLLETMRAENGAIPLLDRHLQRLSASAERFSFRFDAQALVADLSEVLPQTGTHAVRLALSRSGASSILVGNMPPSPALPVPVAPRPLPLPADDWRLWHKTGDRRFHDDARAASGQAEILWYREDGLVTEGSFTNIFVKEGAIYATPPARLGLLPGVLRAGMLDRSEAVEKPLTLSDIKRASGDGRLYIGNALRGLLPARLASGEENA